MAPQPFNPIIVRVIESPTPETTVIDVLVGSVGLIGVLVLLAIVLGLSLGAVLVALRRRRAKRQGPEDRGLGLSPLPLDH